MFTPPIYLASYPDLPMFFNACEKNREGLVDFSHVTHVLKNIETPGYESTNYPHNGHAYKL